MPEGTNLIMSQRERDRLTILSRVTQGELSCRLGAKSLDVSERHLYRILRRYTDEGDRGVIHRLRGQSQSNRSYPKEIQMRALRLFQEQYADYHPTLLSEVLLDEHGIEVSRQTLTRWLTAAGLWAGVRKNRVHRKKRDRREAIGDLIQFDGSHHDWFEGRGPECCLLVAIDDASGRLFLRFAPSENARDVLVTLRGYVERFGVPREIYTDYGAVYKVPPSRQRSHGTKERLTDVGRALQRLGIGHIFARSPQAKGRVERSNRTHQDRLIKALRRNGISTIAEANRFLDQSYIDDHNARFALTDHLPDVHRSVDGLNLDNIFCFETTRSVYNDYTITLDAQFIQLEPSRGKNPSPLPAPRQSVTVRRWIPDNSLHIFWNEHELRFTPLTTRPQHKPRINPKPHPSHPWKHKPPIGRRGRYLLELRSKLSTKHHNKKSLSSITSEP